ncbi:MAG: Re/Si-specific NAD(P)(+) transhydrogenase subunit alpha [bacterium]
MNIGIPKEILQHETRVAIVPSTAAILRKRGHPILLESGAGAAAGFSDREFEGAGATITNEIRALYRQSEVILKLNPPQEHPGAGAHEADLMREGASLFAFLSPHAGIPALRKLAARKITAFAMEYVPRITRAQSMDALSSMATVAGYKAVLLAAARLNKMFPLLMTAAGTIPPANVLVLGAGVAGLQAIATAKRLGAKVEAFDPRPAVKEQVKSLGASFIEMEVTENLETSGGYALEQSEAFLLKERDVIGARLPKTEVVICTALVFGKRAPVLITAGMARKMRTGSVIVDLASEQGGNCELTEPGREIVREGVTIIGAGQLAASVPVDASHMYAKNVTNLFLHIYPKGDHTPNLEDEITRGCCLMHHGEIVNETLKRVLGGAK